MESNLLFRNGFNGTFDVKLSDGHCYANCASGKDWFTVYIIETDPEYRNRGECQKLLETLIEYTEFNGLKFGIYCPMNDTIRHIADKLKIEVYE